MTKAIYCALAMMIGAAIGGTAPAEWRGDSARYAAIATFDAAGNPAVAMAYRPYQVD